jgi:hypothetical protein
LVVELPSAEKSGFQRYPKPSRISRFHSGSGRPADVPSQKICATRTNERRNRTGRQILDTNSIPRRIPPYSTRRLAPKASRKKKYAVPMLWNVSLGASPWNALRNPAMAAGSACCPYSPESAKWLYASVQLSTST